LEKHTKTMNVNCIIQQNQVTSTLHAAILLGNKLHGQLNIKRRTNMKCLAGKKKQCNGRKMSTDSFFHCITLHCITSNQSEKGIDMVVGSSTRRMTSNFLFGRQTYIGNLTINNYRYLVVLKDVKMRRF